MPEIAEVALNVELFLVENLEGQSLHEIEILSGKYTKKPPANFIEFNQSLPSKVTTINTKGKFIYLILENGWSIGMGYGMTGRFTCDVNMKNNRLVLFGGHEILYYNDSRNFGNFFFWPPESDGLDKKLKELGPDLLQNQNLTLEEVTQLFRKYNKWEVTKAIMSQKILAGGGNYIKAEALYLSKINPYAKIESLNDQELYSLYQSMVHWAKLAYNHQRQNIINELPYQLFQDQMAIYNKTHDPNGNPVIKCSDTADKRTTHWVKEVQTIGQP